MLLFVINAIISLSPFITFVSFTQFLKNIQNSFLLYTLNEAYVFKIVFNEYLEEVLLFIINVIIFFSLFSHLSRRPPVAERLRALFLNHSIISSLCLVWVRAPLWPHVRQAKFCLRVCQVVFLGVLPFSPHLLIGPSHMS